MPVFHEYFPVKKDSIAAYVRQQMILEGSLVESNDVAEFSVQSIYEIPRKQSISDLIRECAQDSEKTLRDSRDMNQKMAEIHQMIEDFDDINFVSAPSSSGIDKDRFEVAASESILSLEKRVKTEESSDVADEKKTEKLGNKLKAKSQFTTTSMAGKKSNPHLQKSTSVQSSLSTPTTQRVKFASSSIASPSVSVQQILTEAKDKRKKSQVEIPIPVVHLKFS